MENKFTTSIKNWLIDELECGYLGYNREVYIEDLAYDITEGINMDGSVHCSKFKAERFVKEHFELFGELVDLYFNEYGTILNPFLEPESAEVVAYIEGVRQLLDSLECLETAKHQSNYETIILTKDLIIDMIDELSNTEFNIEW